MKLYTAEWRNGSRGWKLTDPEAVPFLDKCVELGIKNIHVHKGPTIWPLDKDAFDVSDIDHVATDYQDLNFIVEHVGLPRIEDFCFMATQEPNVYAGLAVVIGGLMHARPRFFAKVMGELLFWVGEDKMLFGSDYMIWEPKWQVEGFAAWEMPDDEVYSDYPRLGVEGKKKILGLNAAKLYGIEVPEEFQLPAEAGTPAAQEDAQLVEGRRVIPRSRVLEALGTVYDPELDEPITELGFVGSCVVTDAGRRRRAPAAADAAVRAELRVPHGLRRVLRRAPAARGARGDGRARGPLHGRGDQRGRGARRGVRGGVPRRDGRATSARCASCSGARRCSPARGACARRCWRAGRARGDRRAARGGPARHGGRGAGRGAARRARPAARCGRPGARGRRRGAALCRRAADVAAARRPRAA